MSNEFESPYFTGSDVESTVPEITEQFYEESTLQKLQKMFPNKVFHMKVLLKLYDFCFPKKETAKPVFEKSEAEIVDEIHNTPITLDFGKLLQDQTDSIAKFYAEEALLGKRIAAIPMFIDFAYLYYIWGYDKEAPIHKLPMTIMKFNMITEALQAPPDDLNAYFAQCIENYFIRDLRIEKPPFMVRTDMSPNDIKEKIKMLVKPVCKEILNGLFALDKAKRKTTSISASTPSLAADSESSEKELAHTSRPDNLDNQPVGIPL